MMAATCMSAGPLTVKAWAIRLSLRAVTRWIVRLCIVVVFSSNSPAPTRSSHPIQIPPRSGLRQLLIAQLQPQVQQRCFTCKEFSEASSSHLPTSQDSIDIPHIPPNTRHNSTPRYTFRAGRFLSRRCQQSSTFAVTTSFEFDFHLQ